MDPLRVGFADPPLNARPSIWWYWGETVITEHGITRDLESLRRAGYGGVVIYEQVFTDRPEAYKSLSPDWLARLRFAAAECHRLGLTLEVNVSDGYVAGGPWITPELGMQRLVASATEVSGGQPVAVKLPPPPTTLNFYRDVAVLAFHTPAGGGPDTPPHPQCTTKPADVDRAHLFGTDERVKAHIHPPAGGGAVDINFDYGRPTTMRSLTYSLRPNSKALVIATEVPGSWADDAYGMSVRPDPDIGELQASPDGQTWQTVRTLPAVGYQHDYWTQQTLAFPATTARYFRWHLHDWGHNHTANNDDLVLGNLALHGEARVDWWEKKSGNVVDFSYPDRTPDYARPETVDPEQVRDLTTKLDSNGMLHWTPPSGNWTVLRIGHTPTGARTKHGRPENLGLECDKLSAHATAVQFTNYVGVILREVRRVPGARLAGLNMDSAEHGSQNWTADFAAQFAQRRGYPLSAYLPAMFGYVVGDRARSDRFLYDVRRTIADLMSDEYYGTFRKLAHAEGMTLMAEAPGIATCLPSDNFQAKGRTDIPMGEFWMSQPDGTFDCKETAIAAHIYGAPVAAAEAFTGSRPDASPRQIKPFADAALALGINRFVTLAYLHQPWDDRFPGVTEERFYVPYQRQNTWWADSTGFWTSLGRESFLMRQGHFVADLLFHLGNDTPLKIATWRLRPAPPEGYDYDACGDEILTDRASVQDGRIVLPDGMSYRLLVLAGGNRITHAALNRIARLIHDGATVLGPVKPDTTPTLTDGPEGDGNIRQLADQLWGSGPLSKQGEHAYGAGRMLWGYPPGEALAKLKVAPDFQVLAPAHPGKILYTHRRSGPDDIYFLANHQSTALHLVAAFRVTGAVPERWDPDTGSIQQLTGWREQNDCTEVPLTLEENASTFVVFRPAANSASPAEPAETKLVMELPAAMNLDGPWTVQFTPNWGAPAEVVFTNLVSWTKNPDFGVSHYSGSATYVKTFELAPIGLGHRVKLDLGQVEILASIRLNGQDLGVRWHPPYAVDVTSALRAGTNTLEVRVVNTWVNRLIADAGLPTEKRLTWATSNPLHAHDPVPASGLLGPVRLLWASP